jgi:cytochrome c peroxidase
MDRLAKLDKRTLAYIAIGAVALVVVLVGLFPGDSTDQWSTKERRILAAMQLNQLRSMPRDPSNAYEPRPDVIALGKRFFSDPRFSKSKSISCSTCHQPEHQFQDGRALAESASLPVRRTLPLIGVGYNTWMLWDGRKDSLWSQALGSFETELALGSNRMAAAHLIAAHYRSDYAAVFPALPDLGRLPKDAGPLGSAAEKVAWQAMRPDDRKSVSRVFVNIGKAIAAYQKTLTFGASPLDQYVDGVIKNDPVKLKVLSDSEKNGLRIFIGKGECATCHNGPLLTDQSFHNIGVPALADGKADLGRASGLVTVEQDEFNCLGNFSDAKPEQCAELRFMNRDRIGQKASFKTPGLRNVALRPPYMHTGQLATLQDVIRHYIKTPTAAQGHDERNPIMLSEQEIKDLIAFMQRLSGPLVELKPQE